MTPPTIEIVHLLTHSVIRISTQTTQNGKTNRILWEVPVHPLLPLAQQKQDLLARFLKSLPAIQS
jgi:hypothetical protein